jgi:hypothetical protein
MADEQLALGVEHEHQPTPPSRPRQSRARGGDEYEMTVPDGTTLNIAVTALIKNLRRGRELEALYWAEQIERQYWKYLWRRLLIFASEDVNIGNPDAVVQVRALYENYCTVKSESKNPVVDRSIVTMAVMVLARSPKSRECDDLLNVIVHLQRQYGWRPPNRDEVFDLHTREGKRRWKRKYRLRHWLEAASKEEPRVGPRDWHLWLLKWAAQRGIYTVESVQQAAEIWESDGLLRHGAEGEVTARIPWTDVTPEFPDLEPVNAPIVFDSTDVGGDGFMADDWHWHCTTCGTPADICRGMNQNSRYCCEDCNHPDSSIEIDGREED